MENALKKSLNMTQEKTAEIRDTGKQVTTVEADLKSLSFCHNVMVGKYFCHSRRKVIFALGTGICWGNFQMF